MKIQDNVPPTLDAEIFLAPILPFQWWLFFGWEEMFALLISCLQNHSLLHCPLLWPGLCSRWSLWRFWLIWKVELVKNQSQILLGNCKGKLSPALSTITAERELFIHLRPSWVTVQTFFRPSSGKSYPALVSGESASHPAPLQHNRLLAFDCLIFGLHKWSCY